MTTRGLALLCAVSLTGLPLPGQAQSPGAYEDRLIDGGALPPQISTGSGAESSDQGWPRSVAISVQAGGTEQGGNRTSYLGAIASAQIDTPLYGAFSMELNARRDPNSLFGVIEQRRMPLDGGWFTSNAVGVISTATPGSARLQGSRFILPTTPIQGLATRWEQPQRGLEFVASTGQQVQFNADGTAVGIERTQGLLSTAGAQWASEQWVAGGTAFVSRDTFDSGVVLKRADALHSYAGWRSGETRAQAQVLQSRNSVAGNANGVWADMTVRTGTITHDYGVFRFEPGLTWGPLAVISDLQGAHYRASFRSRQWVWDANLEAFSSVSGAQPDGQYLALNGRYQASRDLGVGGSAAMRKQGGSAYAWSAFVESINALGNTRAQLDWQEDTAAQRTQRLTLDQAWPTQGGWRLSSAVGYESLKNSPASGQANSNAVLASALLGAEPLPSFNLDLSVRTRHVLNGGGEQSQDASLSARWQFHANWVLSFSYAANRGEFSLPVSLDPLQQPGTTIALPSNKSFFVALRYQDQAGRASAPLGGRPGSAAGSVRGQLYLDANDNGKRDAGEAGVANVTVVLDGRFSVRTDAQGSFEFPFVAAGDHKLTVVQDNLPLPWFAPESAAAITVSTRSVTQIDLGARRQ